MFETPSPPTDHVATNPDAAVRCPEGHAGTVPVGPDALHGALRLWSSGERAVAPPCLPRDRGVDVAIPLRCDQASIVYCLAGLHAQTCRPRRIVLIEDGCGARDGTLVLAREFAVSNGLRLEMLTVPSGSRAMDLSVLAGLFDGEALLVLDGGTVLDSPDYLERCMRILQADPEVAGVGGAALPLRDEDRRAWARSDAFRRWVGNDEYRDPCAPRSDLQRVGRWIADAYRESVALVRQSLPRRRPMNGPDRATPLAGAVLYRRDVLDRSSMPADVAQVGEPGLRADTVPGFSKCWVVQRPGVRARIQSTDRLAAAHVAAAHVLPSPGPRRLGPMRGLALPALAMALLLVGGWRWLAAVALVELALWLSVLALVAPARPLATLGRGLLVAPLRYVEIAVDAAGALRGLVVRPR